jgi:hypothetical protein
MNSSVVTRVGTLHPFNMSGWTRAAIKHPGPSQSRVAGMCNFSTLDVLFFLYPVSRQSG